MQATLILGGLAVLVIIIAVVIAVKYGDSKGFNRATRSIEKITAKRRLDADEVLAQPVAAEDPWIAVRRKALEDLRDRA